MTFIFGFIVGFLACLFEIVKYIISLCKKPAELKQQEQKSDKRNVQGYLTIS